MTSPMPASNFDTAIIIASANATLRRKILQGLERVRVPAAEALGGADALSKLETSDCQLLLLDRELPDLVCDELLEIIHQRFPGIDVLLMDEAGNPCMPSAWRSDSACRLFEGTGLWQASSAPATARPAGEVEPLPGMVGRSEAMAEVYRIVRLVASRSTPVLISGATGTGKELVASAIHQLSPRAARPFVVINCAAIPEPLLESELFGYVRGAFTGAVQSRLGRVHGAHGGTLFLDEIGELPLGLQSKLLRFLDHGEVQRLGSSDVFRVDVRVVAATNADLRELAGEKRFREDLLYRLSVFPVELPPLSQRREDIARLAKYFLRTMEGSEELDPRALSVLENHSWPGNVRELQHVLERASILAQGGPILPEHLGLVSSL